MASEEYIKRAIQTNRSYDDLPPRVRSILSLTEWKTKVKDYCIQKGLAWESSMAKTAASEQEYYEDLLRAYRTWHRLFPYHLADYICRVLRITPFKYYCEVLVSAMKEEKSYDRIPNFTAADIVRILGIGRNEYIQNMNACKAKKLLWRVNKGICRDYLPTEPLTIKFEPWWNVSVVNLGETEYRELTIEEKATLKSADKGSKAGQLDPDLLQVLHKRGQIYFHIPVAAEDRFSIPPLEGFVSNKNSEQGDATTDPVESVLYAVFVASSERIPVQKLAGILNMDLPPLQQALSVAARLGFATRLDDRGKRPDDLLLLDDEPGAAPAADGQALEAEEQQEEGDSVGPAVAVVLDAEATSYLMMGALSPGLKRHAVTLFEGGRVAGDGVIQELVQELWVSHDQGKGFEGDMKKLTSYSAALATLLECVREAASGRSLELVRKESLAGLSPAAACRVLSHAYCAVVPITPMPYPPLPLTPDRPGPAYFGPTAEATSPWLQLALYSAAQCGPLSLIFPAGQRVWRLPPQLDCCSHAVLWPWDSDVKVAGGDSGANLVDAQFLLYTLNDLLSKTAVMVQPLDCGTAAGGRPAAGDEEVPKGHEKDDFASLVDVVDVPLPLPQGNDFGTTLIGIDNATGREAAITVPSSVQQAVWELGVATGVGSLRMMRLRCSPPGAQQAPHTWIPLSIQLGVPLYSLPLCKAVCQRAREEGFLTPEGRAAHTAGQRTLQQHLTTCMLQHATCSQALVVGAAEGAASYVDLPISNLLFDGNKALVVELGGCLQGMGSLIWEA